MHQIDLTPRMQEAVEELKRLITKRFPQAAFVVEEGFDPEGQGDRIIIPLNLRR
jgi:hypothetical protein